MSTRIEWCDMTLNPFIGCTKCSPGCDHCYAERFAARLARNPNTAFAYRHVIDAHGHWNGKVYGQFIAWPRPARKGKRIFVGSMCDIFHENVKDYTLLRMFAVLSLCRKHTFIFLTKRPERMRSVFTEITTECFHEVRQEAAHIISLESPTLIQWPPSNFWLGVTVCNQQEADEKIPILLQTPAAKRFVSVEPMLGQVSIEKFLRGSYECGRLSCGKRMSFRDLPEMQCTKCGFVGPDDETWGDGDCAVCPECGQDGCCGAIEAICPDCGHYLVRDHPATPYIDWVICGGETGPGARPMHPEWVRFLRDQCKSANVPFFFKSWGEWTTEHHYHDGILHLGGSYEAANDISEPWPSCIAIVPVARVGKKRAGRLLDGREWNEIPEAHHE